MLNRKIKAELDEYLGFNSSTLFQNSKNLARVFGGAIRDIITGDKIHDIDILLGSKTLNHVEGVLQQNGYRFFEQLNGKDLQEMYSEIHIITEPKTWIKGDKIVQLIRPSINSKGSEEAYITGFRDLISNVDLSCCGVSWDGQEFHEDFPNAFLHCQCKVFSENKQAKMYSKKRIHQRIWKLSERGWKEIQNSDAINRDLKLKLLEQGI